MENPLALGIGTLFLITIPIMSFMVNYYLHIGIAVLGIMLACYGLYYEGVLSHIYWQMDLENILTSYTALSSFMRTLANSYSGIYLLTAPVALFIRMLNYYRGMG